MLAAADYKNEPEVGDALAEALSMGLVQRKDLFITTKASFCLHALELCLILSIYMLPFQ